MSQRQIRHQVVDSISRILWVASSSVLNVVCLLYTSLSRTLPISVVALARLLGREAQQHPHKSSILAISSKPLNNNPRSP